MHCKDLPIRGVYEVSYILLGYIYWFCFRKLWICINHKYKAKMF